MIPVMLPGAGRVHAAEGEFADETLCGILRAETGLGVFDPTNDPDLALVDCRVCRSHLDADRSCSCGAVGRDGTFATGNGRANHSNGCNVWRGLK